MSDFEGWLDTIDFDSYQPTMRETYEAGRKTGVDEGRAIGLTEAAEIVGGGCFYHENAPDAIFARAASAAIMDTLKAYTQREKSE